MGGQRSAQKRLAFENVRRVFLHRDLIDVQMRGVIAEIRARIEPQIQNLAQPLGPELHRAAGVDKSDHGDFLIAEGRQQTLRDGPNSLQRARAAVAAARQIVDRDGDFAPGGQADAGAQNQPAEDSHASSHYRPAG